MRPAGVAFVYLYTLREPPKKIITGSSRTAESHTFVRQEKVQKFLLLAEGYGRSPRRYGAQGPCNAGQGSRSYGYLLYLGKQIK